MSPLSFLSSFAFPAWSSIPSIGSYIPENIQKRLVSYLLQRTLGKFVKQDGLQLEGIEAAINQGRVRLEGLQIDTAGVNATLPADFPYRFREGQLDSIDISLPFPNLWSGPLSLGISSIQLTLESKPVKPIAPTPSLPEDPQEWNIDKSIYAASTDFVRTVLNQDEDDQLQASMYNLHMKEPEQSLDEDDFDPFAPDEAPQAPGGFPGSINAVDGRSGGTAGLVESMLEALLARLQVSVGEIVVRIHHEVPARAEEIAEDVDLELKIEGIRYALHQSGTDAAPKKTLTVDDVGVWMSSEKVPDQRSTSASPNTVRAVEDDMMMSLGIADLRESRYGLPGLKTRRQFPDSEEENPAESLYESAIGDDTPTASPNIQPSAAPRTSSDSARRVRNKIFGLRRRGIVVQMWKEPIDAGQDTTSEGSPIAQARISVDLGNLAVVLTSEEIKSLIMVAGCFPASRQGQLSEQTTNAVGAGNRRGSTPHCKILADRVDLHYFHASTLVGVSQSDVYWNRTDEEGIKEDNLHLQLLDLQILRTERDVFTISLSSCALVDAYRQFLPGDELLRRQPIMLIGKSSELIWLPSEEDVKQEASLALAEVLDGEAQISLSFSEPGRTLLLKYIRLYLDPSRLKHLIRPLQQLFLVYHDAFDAPGGSNVMRASSASTSAAALRLDIRMLSTRIYNAPSQEKAVPHAVQVPGRVGLDASGILLERSNDGAIQARMDWLKADLSDPNTADPQTWFTCGNVASFGDHEKALDFRYLPNRSKRVSMVIALLTLQLEQVISHRLQYFADDFNTWVEKFLSDPSDTPGEDSRLIGSRFLAQDDVSLDTDSIDSQSTIEEGMHVECVILKAVVGVRTSDRIVNLEATNIDTIIRGVSGAKKGNVVDCTIFSVEMSETALEIGQTKTILRSDMRDKGGAGLEVRPVITLSLLSTQEIGNGYKETIVSINVSNTFANISPGIHWVHDLQSVLSSPPGVFENVVPSDSTKVSLTIQDCVLFLPASTRQGAISLDIGNCSMKTRLLASTIKRTVDFKLGNIAISLSDNYATAAHMKRSGTVAEDGDFALICLLRDSRLVLSASSERRMKIDVSYAGVDISLCADTLEALKEVTGDIFQSWMPLGTNSGSASCESNTPPQTFGPSSEKHSLLGSLSDIAPSLAASSFEEDMLQDDIPSNTDFVTQSTGANGNSIVPHMPLRKSAGESDNIRILSGEPFELYQDYMAELEESRVKNVHSSSLPLLVVGTAVNIRILLYSGYDWQATRSAIESETEVLRRRLRKLSHLISSGNVPPPELRRTNVELFNSVHIGIRDEEDYEDDDQLLAAIENELADLDSETASHTTFKPHGSARSNGSSPKTGSATKVKLRRSRRPQMEFSLRDVAICYSVDDPAADITGSLKMSMQRTEIIDHIKSSTWKKFMTEMHANGANGLGETEAKMLRVRVEWVNPGFEGAPEARVNVDVAPLRFHIDQDALDFMKRFFSFSRHDGRSASPTAPPTPKSNKGFIQYVEIQPVQVKIDYKPKRLNLKALQQGSAMEVINLFHFESAMMTLRHVTMNGVTSWGDLYSQLLSIWTPDVKANQMSDLLTGIAPVRSMVKVGSGVADLILLPLEQYRKDGKIVKGIRRGATSFAANTLSEVATVGAQLATGTQVILEKAERALGGRQAEEAQFPDMMESINLTEYEASLAGKRSRYANQPANLNQGISAAYTSLTSNLTSAAQTILAVPMEVIEETGSQQSATRAVIRAVPIAVLQSMIGITDASRKTLFGVKNQLDPKNQGDKESKYKRR